MFTKPQLFFIIISTIFLATATTAFLLLLITTLSHHHHHHNPPPTFPSTAAQFLNSHGFTFISNLITTSPDLFLPAPQATIFAIPDSIISNLSLPPYTTIQLVTYHIVPNKLTFQDLLKKPLNSCLCTLFQQHKVSITKKDEEKRLLEINHVLVTNPNFFLHDSVAIHAVNGPFASFTSFQEITDHFPICNQNLNQSQASVSNTSFGPSLDVVKMKAEWKMVAKFLKSSGFTPFAYWLYNVLDGIVKDHPNVHTMTIFAPPVMEVMEMEVETVHRVMRYHIVPKKYSFRHLVSMPKGALMMTLCDGKEVEITGSVDELLLIDGVEVTSPDLLSSRSFVVHGIARGFEMDRAARMLM